MDIVLTGAILLYPRFFQARSISGSEPKYSASFIIYDDEEKAKVLAWVEEIIEEDFSKKTNRSKLNLGYKYRDENELHYPGAMMVGAYSSGSAERNEPPEIVDQNLQPITSANDIYGGSKVNAFLGMFTYNQDANKGVSFGLNCVQLDTLAEEGSGLPRIDGRKSAKQVFKAIAGAPLGKAKDPSLDTDDSAWD